MVKSNVKTALFQTIQFSISMQFSSIWLIDRTLSGAITLAQRGPRSDGNDGVPHIPQNSNITGTSPSDRVRNTSADLDWQNKLLQDERHADFVIMFLVPVILVVVCVCGCLGFHLVSALSAVGGLPSPLRCLWNLSYIFLKNYPISNPLITHYHSF